MDLAVYMLNKGFKGSNCGRLMCNKHGKYIIKIRSDAIYAPEKIEISSKPRKWWCKIVYGNDHMNVNLLQLSMEERCWFILNHDLAHVLTFDKTTNKTLIRMMTIMGGMLVCIIVAFGLNIPSLSMVFYYIMIATFNIGYFIALPIATERAAIRLESMHRDPNLFKKVFEKLDKERSKKKARS